MAYIRKHYKKWQAQGGWKTLKALQRYLHIQAEHLAKKLKERG